MKALIPFKYDKANGKWGEARRFVTVQGGVRF